MCEEMKLYFAIPILLPGEIYGISGRHIWFRWRGYIVSFHELTNW